MQKSRAISQTASLASTDPLGAARLLYEFVKAYEGYNPTVDRVAGSYHANLSADKRSGPPYAYWGGIWDRWWYNDLPQLAPLIRTYAQLKDTNVFDLLSDEFGEDVEAKIVDGLILKSAEFVLTYPEYMSNMSFQPWKGLIEVGKALNKPDYIHRAVELIERMVSGMFMSDGYWQEVTPSYHLQTVSGLVQVTDMLRGWSDPEGYVSPRTGTTRAPTAQLRTPPCSARQASGKSAPFTCACFRRSYTPAGSTPNMMEFSTSAFRFFAKNR